MNRPTPQSKRISLIIETSTESGRNLLHGVMRYARQKPDWFIHHEWRNTDVFTPQWLRFWHGDGMIARLETQEIADLVLRRHVPVIDVLGNLNLPGIPSAQVDHEAIAAMAADHLLGLGFRHFAYCGLKDVPWSIRRGEAFRACLRARGRDCRVHEWTATDEYDWDEEVGAMLRFLVELPRPCGIMLCNDHHSRLVMETCNRHGMAIPDEFAVIGVDDDPTYYRITDPPLTSIQTDDENLGYCAAGLLDRIMDGKPWNGTPLAVPPRGVAARTSTDVTSVSDDEVSRAAAYIRKYALGDISVDDIVRSVGISRTLLQRRYRDQLGRTLHGDILSVRLQEARRLLEETRMSMAGIADQCGFTHQAHFAQVFRRRFDRTPLQHRRMYAKD